MQRGSHDNPVGGTQRLVAIIVPEEGNRTEPCADQAGSQFLACPTAHHEIIFPRGFRTLFLECVALAYEQLSTLGVKPSKTPKYQSPLSTLNGFDKTGLADFSERCGVPLSGIEKQDTARLIDISCQKSQRLCTGPWIKRS